MQNNYIPRLMGAGVACTTAFLALTALLLPAAGQAASAAPTTAPAAAPVAVVDTDPGKLIETAAQAMLAELDAHRADFRKDPAKINDLVDRILLPHFDTSYSARLVLGRHWNAATPEQRQRFIDGFYHSLLTNYGTALLDFTGDRLKVFPYKPAEPASPPSGGSNGAGASNNATVRTQVRKDDGSTVAVNYSLHRTDKGWMAWDVNIEGISYVKSFRDDFGAEIDQKGLDAVIERLEKQGNAKKK
jgi:phospholipid transport system substrate-binding protein